MMLAMFCFVAVNACLKLTSQLYPPSQIVFFRNFFGLFPLLILLAHQKAWHTLRIPHYTIHILRAGLGVVSLSCLFKSIQFLPFSEATVLMFAASIFVMIFSYFMLKESLSRGKWAAILVGFLGVIIVVNPSAETLNVGVLFGLISAAIEGFMMVQGRQLSQTIAPLAIAWYMALFAAILSSLSLPIVWVSPASQDWPYLVMLGIGGGIGQYFLISAYARTTASTLAPLIYTMLLWSVLFDFILFQIIPARSLFIGAACIIASGLYVVYSERR